MGNLSQTSAPVYEALDRFRKKRVVPFDVPGHKRGKGNKELDDFLARALLEGRNMTAVIITAVLEEKNKTEFNNLIYNKVEEDLIWIRMNGCIVGAVIGLIIFCGLELFNRM